MLPFIYNRIEWIKSTKKSILMTNQRGEKQRENEHRKPRIPLLLCNKYAEAAIS